MRIKETPQWVVAVAVVVVVVVVVTKAVTSDSLSPKISRFTSTNSATKVNKTHFIVTNTFPFR